MNKELFHCINKKTCVSVCIHTLISRLIITNYNFFFAWHKYVNYGKICGATVVPCHNYIQSLDVSRLH